MTMKIAKDKKPALIPCLGFRKRHLFLDWSRLIVIQMNNDKLHEHPYTC